MRDDDESAIAVELAAVKLDGTDEYEDLVGALQLVSRNRGTADATCATCGQETDSLCILITLLEPAGECSDCGRAHAPGLVVRALCETCNALPRDSLEMCAALDKHVESLLGLGAEH